MSRVYFYSERGLINSLILDLQNNLTKTRDFLNFIKLGINETQFDWTNKIQSVDWYIEFSASEFGDPDVIADISCSDKHRVIFFEAKLKSYEKSSAPMNMSAVFDPQNDGIYKDKSSSINAQLALRYRLAQTLKTLYSSENGGILLNADEPRIEESREAALSYHDMFKAIRETQTGRRIHNPLMIKVLKKIMENNPEFYFVAMTFEERDHTFRDIQTNKPHHLPPLGTTRWESENNRFGILNINNLIQSFQLEDNSYLTLSRDYIHFNLNDNQNTSETDDDIEEYDIEEDEQRKANLEELSSKDTFLQHNLPHADVYADWFDNLRLIGKDQFHDFKSSCSLTKQSKTIVKLIYRNHHVYLGFRDKLPHTLTHTETTTISIKGVKFACIIIDAHTESYRDIYLHEISQLLK